MNRRTMLAGASVFALAGCGIFTSKTDPVTHVTTYTMDVAKIDKYAQAFKSGVATVLSVPGVEALLGVYLVPFKAIEGIVVQDIAAFDTATGGLATVDYNSSSAQAAIDSLLNDGKKILTTIAAALPQTAIVGTLMSAVNAVQTIVLLFEALLPGTVAASRASVTPPMTEAQALAVLGVH